MKIITVVGARPNFIKIAPLFEELEKRQKIESILVHTGQHYDFNMSAIFFKELNIVKPNYNLKISSGLAGKQIKDIMAKFEKVCLKEKPDLVIVLGDVNSTLAGALTAKKLNIPIAHIEAGLRSFDMSMPEEINRLLTDHVSDFLFCPTKTSAENLKKEGIKKGIYIVGDIMYDAFLKNSKIAPRKSKIRLKLKNYLLLTIHRAKNTDNLERLNKIIKAVSQSNENIIFPVHPRTAKKLKKINISKFKNLKTIKPVSYFDMLMLEKNAVKIITDAGGVQKEAYWFKKPCITLRERTEWIETVKSNWNILVGDNSAKIVEAIKEFNPHGLQKEYFGNGKASKAIIKCLNL